MIVIFQYITKISDVLLSIDSRGNARYGGWIRYKDR